MLDQDDDGELSYEEFAKQAQRIAGGLEKAEGVEGAMRIVIEAAGAGP